MSDTKTTGEACMLAGFDCTLIEREAQHTRDIEHRIKRWSGLDAPLFAEPEPSSIAVFALAVGALALIRGRA